MSYSNIVQDKPRNKASYQSVIMKITAAVGVIVLCCLLALTSAEGGLDGLAKAQWHVRAPARGCSEIAYYRSGSYYRVYACNGIS